MTSPKPNMVIHCLDGRMATIHHPWLPPGLAIEMTAPLPSDDFENMVTNGALRRAQNALRQPTKRQKKTDRPPGARGPSTATPPPVRPARLAEQDTRRAAMPEASSRKQTPHVAASE